MRSQDEEPQGPVIRDRRRIDPATGQVRYGGQAGQAPRGPGQPRPGRHSVSKPGGGSGTSQAGSPPAAASASAPASDGPGASGPGAGQRSDEADRLAQQLAERSQQLAERTADLQRLQAEYANYRKRVDRDRMAVREQALANVLSELLPVLDDIGLAREHGELTGGFKSVADSLEGVATKLGLTSYGESGDPFDPNVHDALMHSYSADVTEPTCVRILQPGYKVADRILRPARVAVAEPGEDDASGPPGDSAGPQDKAGRQDKADPEDKAAAPGAAGTGTTAASAGPSPQAAQPGQDTGGAEHGPDAPAKETGASPADAPKKN
jgi:molecular chaperone GrpE